MVSKTRIALVGGQGKLGRAIQEVVRTEILDRVEIAVVIGRDANPSLPNIFEGTDVVLDVSLPMATTKWLGALTQNQKNIPYVIGCTGWTPEQLETIDAYAKNSVAVLAPNFSPGVNLFLNLIEQAAPVLQKWKYDVSIHELHHSKKLDSPSGTAKAIVDRLGNARSQTHSTRAGNIVGTHEIRFIGAGDVLTFTHEALDRKIFARGAVMAAEWAANQSRAGLYSMSDVIFGDRNKMI